MPIIFRRVLNWLFILYAQWESHYTPSPKPNSSPVITAAQLIYSRNAPLITYYPNPLDPKRQIDCEIHKLSLTEATQIATLLVDAATKTGLSIPYLLACSYQESRWDPACYSRNLAEHHGVLSFAGTDWGFGQNSGAQLLASQGFASLPDDAARQAHACDPTWGVPYFVANYQSLLQWADQQLTQDPTLSAKIHALPSDVFQLTTDRQEITQWLATLAYNRGRTGALAVINAGGLQLGRAIVHGAHVQTWYAQFKPLFT